MERKSTFFYFSQVGPAEFSLANNILKLVYGQALLLYVTWLSLDIERRLCQHNSLPPPSLPPSLIPSPSPSPSLPLPLSLGMLFCPLLPAMGFLKNVLLFYCRAFAVLYFNRPPHTLFRVASTRHFYLALLLLTVFLCALPVGYAIVQMTPSLSCGPFRQGHVTSFPGSTSQLAFFHRV